MVSWIRERKKIPAPPTLYSPNSWRCTLSVPDAFTGKIKSEDNRWRREDPRIWRIFFFVKSERSRHLNLYGVYSNYKRPCLVYQRVYTKLTNERPTWCHLLFYFTYYALNMFRTLIYPSSGACDCVDELSHRSSCSVKTDFTPTNNYKATQHITPNTPLHTVKLH